MLGAKKEPKLEMVGEARELKTTTKGIMID